MKRMIILAVVLVALAGAALWFVNEYMQAASASNTPDSNVPEPRPGREEAQS